jgi:hypothetical protein
MIQGYFTIRSFTCVICFNFSQIINSTETTGLILTLHGMDDLGWSSFKNYIQESLPYIKLIPDYNRVISIFYFIFNRNNKHQMKIETHLGTNFGDVIVVVD